MTPSALPPMHATAARTMTTSRCPGWRSSRCSVHLMTGYPPEPWELRGQLHVTVWRVPSAHLPRLSAELEPVRVRGTALVATAWVIYEPGGVLSYRELLVAVLAHRGGRPLVTITDIWVNSVPSLHGGRALWGIPKQWASFRVDGATCAAVDAEPGPTGGDRRSPALRARTAR